MTTLADLSPLQLRELARSRDAELRALDKLDAEESLVSFMKLGWSTLEPQRPYVDGWAMDAIAEHLTAVTNGQITKLLMNVPPGFAKSLTTSVFWPAWEWGPRNLPATRYVCASYSEALTIRDNVRCRGLMRAPFYQEMWGDRFSFQSDQDAKMKFANDKTGFKLATSVGGVGTGERGDRVIIDDPHNVLEGESDARRENVLQWFTEVLPTRVNDPKKAVFIVIMQRVHEQDVSGLILAKELGYEHLCIPMHYDQAHPYASKSRSSIGWRDPRTVEGQLAFPERYDEKAVAEMSQSMMAWGGTYACAGQLEQRPEPRGGGMVKWEWFEIVDDLPDDESFSFARGWDFAGTEGGDGAGTAAVKTAIGDVTGDIYVCDVVWERVSPGGLVELIGACVLADGYECFQSFPEDPGQAGLYQSFSLADVLQGYDFEFTKETGDKEIRFRPFAAQCEVRSKGRKVKILRRSWLDRYKDHVSKFPRGRYKDIPDAQSRSYGACARRRGSGFSGGVGGSTLIEG